MSVCFVIVYTNITLGSSMYINLKLLKCTYNLPIIQLKQYKVNHTAYPLSNRNNLRN